MKSRFQTYVATASTLAILAMVALVTMAQTVPQSVISGNSFECALDAVDNNTTQCQAAPASGEALYIKRLDAQSTTTTPGLFLIGYGTGTNCGTGTTVLFPSRSSVVRYQYPASTSPMLHLTFDPPLRVPKEKALCVLAVATNTMTVHIGGYIAQ